MQCTIMPKFLATLTRSKGLSVSMAGKICPTEGLRNRMLFACRLGDDLSHRFRPGQTAFLLIYPAIKSRQFVRRKAHAHQGGTDRGTTPPSFSVIIY